MDMLTTIFNQLNNQDTVKTLTDRTSASPDKVQQVSQAGLPMIMQALNRNASTESGAKSLSQALEQHKNKDVENLPSFFGQVNQQDGNKILNHAFGSNQSNVENSLAKNAGLDSSAVQQILSALAPLALSMLAKKKQENSVDASGLSGLTGMMTKELGQKATNSNSNSPLSGLVTSFLDKDKDGSIIDDAGDMLGSFFKK